MFFFAKFSVPSQIVWESTIGDEASTVEQHVINPNTNSAQPPGSQEKCFKDNNLNNSAAVSASGMFVTSARVET